jgi:Rha family phage regulatory protein
METIQEVASTQVLVHAHPAGHDYVWSYELAAVFGKRHGDVLRAIDDAMGYLTDEERARYFSQREREVAVGAPLNGVQRYRKDRYFALTRDGFTYTIMGFTGPKAARFKVAYIERFKELEKYRFEAELTKSKAAVEAPAESILQLVPFTARQTQLQCSRLVSSHLMRGLGDANPAIAHFRNSFSLLTGKTPTNYVNLKYKEGFKVRGKSGREVLRRLEPAKACTLAMIDDQVIRYGISVAEQERVGLPQALVPAFDALLKLGYGLPQLEINAKKPAKKLGK